PARRRCREEIMPNEDPLGADIDEYLWPLTGALTAVDWLALTEELHIRKRLAEIAAHVREFHIAPRLRRGGPPSSPALVRAIKESVIAGPGDAPPWEITLKEPVPRALREEWRQLAARLQTIEEQKRCGAAARVRPSHSS